MKKHLLLVAVIMITGAVVSYAQPGGGGFQRRTVEERVQAVHNKIDSAFKPEAAKLTQIDAVFTKYYKDSDKLREEMMSGGERPDFQAMREKMQPLTDARDKELKTLLGDDNYKVWKDSIEPSMMPRRQGGGGGGRNGQ